MRLGIISIIIIFLILIRYLVCLATVLTPDPIYVHNDHVFAAKVSDINISMIFLLHNMQLIVSLSFTIFMKIKKENIKWKKGNEKERSSRRVNFQNS